MNNDPMLETYQALNPLLYQVLVQLELIQNLSNFESHSSFQSRFGRPSTNAFMLRC